MTVIYKGKSYQVLSDKHLGRTDMFKLASNFSGGSAFGVLKSQCKVTK